MNAPYLVIAPSPLEHFSALVADDDSFPLTEVAISLAQDEDPGLDVQSTLAEIDALALRLRERIPADSVVLQKLRYLNRYFFRDLGFAGNVNDYYSSANSYLHALLRTRRGIPISLAVLYIELAQQIGLTARGVAFPGHFLVKVRMPQGEVIIDPFTGHSLTRDELEERLAPYKRRQGLLGEFDMPLGLFLQSATSREVIARMLRNLKEIHRAAEDWGRLLSVQQRLVILLPSDWSERRDRGLTHAELGAWDAAAADLDVYLDRSPQADDRGPITERVAELRAQGRPRQR